MPIMDAIKFIKAASKNESLRQSLYAIPSDEIYTVISEKGYTFTENEFEDSINMLHVQCQTEEQASLLFEVVYWFRMLIRRPNPVAAFNN